MSRVSLRLKALLGLIVLTAIAFGQTTPPPDQNPPARQGQAQGAGNPIDAKTKEEVLTQLADVVTKRAFVPGVEFSKWPEFVAKHKEELDKAETDTAFGRVMNGILRDFGVSHIRFSTPRAAQMRQSGTTSGLGMRVKKVDAGLEITTVMPQGPAGALGIEVGDIIKEVENKPATDPAAIQVEVGKKVAVKIQKKNGELKDFTLENKTFSNRRPETLTWIGDDAAVLRVWTFSTGYDRKNIEKLMTEANAKAKYLVIDLRSNGGGAVANLNHFLSLLMPDATPVGTFIGRSTAEEYAKEHTEGTKDPIAIAAWNPRKYKTNKREVEPFTGKIAVLLNRGSASASEICGAALRECRGAVLVGAKSAGLVLASVYAKLPGGFELQYPLQDYVTIKGMRLEGHPLEPDMVVERGAPDSKDEAPDKAIELMKKKSAEHKQAA